MTRSLLRFALAGVASATAFYLIPASVHIVAWPASGPVRIALLPPLSRLWWSEALTTIVGLGLFAAARDHADRRDRWSAAAVRLCLLFSWLIPFLPWVTDRAPLLLVLAGPLRWVVAAVAVGWAVASGVPPMTWPRLALSRSAVLVVSLALYAVLGLRFAASAGFGGDEPHYLVITHSLLVDHDLDIANNHEHRDYKAFYGGNLRPDYLQRSQDGRIYSIHAPGLPALLVPAYAVGGASAAVFAIAVLAALTALAIFDLALLLTDRTTATLVWLGTCLTVPFVPHAWLIYPELPGALIVAWSALWMWRADLSPTREAVHGALLAGLPWLHTKFVVLLGLMAMVQVLRLRTRVRSLLMFTAPIAVSLALWLYFFYRIYGTLDPEAPYGSSAQLNVLVQNIPHGLLGLFFDQKFGVLAYSPVYALALVGFVLMCRDHTLRALAAALVLVTGVFLLATTRFYMWWGGSSAPARFVVPVIPLLAPAIAIAIDRWRGIGGRALVTGTLLTSVAVACACVWIPQAPFLFNDPHGVSALVQAAQGAAPLDVSLPTFTEENWLAPLGLLLGWLTTIGVGIAATAGAIRSGLVRSSWTAAVSAVMVFGVTASAFEGGRTSGRNAADRSAIAFRGQMAAIHAFDPARLRVVDLSSRRRLSGPGLPATLTIDRRSDSESEAGKAGQIGSPVDLPEGEYEARVWFDSIAGRAGELRAVLSPQVVLARTGAPFGNPAVVRFRMAVPTLVQIELSDQATASAWRRLEIVPLALAAGDARSAARVRAVEAVEGRSQAYIAYTDDHAYPEGGVFWTRGTEAAHLLLVANGASVVHLILHVGPDGSQIAIDVGEQRLDFDLSANETREVTARLPAGTSAIPLSVRSARDFRPADVDPGSDDQRRLGCQVRPRLDPD